MYKYTEENKYGFYYYTKYGHLPEYDHLEMNSLSIKHGKNIELESAYIMEQIYPIELLTTNKNNKYDLEFHVKENFILNNINLKKDENFTVEVKSDNKSTIFGNTVIEFEKRIIDTGKIIPSGLSVSKADFWVKRAGFKGETLGLYIINIQVLRRLIQKNYPVVSMYNSDKECCYMYRIPMVDFNKYSENVLLKLNK